jgi:hypothetical protein
MNESVRVMVILVMLMKMSQTTPEKVTANAMFVRMETTYRSRLSHIPHRTMRIDRCWLPFTDGDLAQRTFSSGA